MSGAEAMVGITLVTNAMEGVAKNEAAKYNAQVMAEQSKLQQGASLEKQRVLRRQGAQHIASQRVAAGKSGVAMEGSVLDAIAQSEASLARDLKIERIQAKYAASAAKSEAEAMRVQGRNAQTAGMGGILGYGTVALFGGS
jgi:hypothetical protein